MSAHNPIKLLNDHDLRRTASRSNILNILINSQVALSENEIEEQISDCDRATIYRTLKTFLDKGLVHKILDENNIVKYAFCSTHCSPEQHNHEHVHFKCSQCGAVSCLHDVMIHEIKLPKGYSVKETHFLMIGTCGVCEEKK